MEICEKCGLPKDLCVCEEMVKETQRVRLSMSRRRFGKWMTIIEGIDDPNIDLDGLSKRLKAGCACGGTVKDGCIELQGNHKKKIEEILNKMGYTIEHNI
jgi:translation initiation factor 1